MSDINNNFITSYPPEDVYGLGIAGPSSQSDNKPEPEEEKKVQNTTSQKSENSNVKTEEVNNSEKNTTEKGPIVQTVSNTSDNENLEDYLGNNIDTTA